MAVETDSANQHIGKAQWPQLDFIGRFWRASYEYFVLVLFPYYYYPYYLAVLGDAVVGGVFPSCLLQETTSSSIVIHPTHQLLLMSPTTAHIVLVHHCPGLQ